VFFMCFCVLFVGKLTFRDCVGLFLTCAVGNKADYDGTGGALAQLAIGASDIVALLGWANDTFAALGGVEGISGPLWDHRNYGSSLQIDKPVSMGKVIRRKVNCEAVSIRRLHGFPIACVFFAWLVGICKSTPTFIGIHNLFQFVGVDIVADSGQITRLVVTPNLPTRKCANLLGQDIKGVPTLVIGNLVPMHGKRSAFSIAPASF
jgi:hypothetical protein